MPPSGSNPSPLAPPSINSILKAGLSCAICHDLIHHPHALACGHIFCQSCLATWFQESLSCPKCRRDAETAPVPLYELHDMIMQLNSFGHIDSDTVESFRIRMDERGRQSWHEPRQWHRLMFHQTCGCGRVHHDELGAAISEDSSIYSDLFNEVDSHLPDEDADSDADSDDDSDGDNSDSDDAISDDSDSEMYYSDVSDEAVHQRPPWRMIDSSSGQSEVEYPQMPTDGDSNSGPTFNERLRVHLGYVSDSLESDELVYSAMPPAYSSGSSDGGHQPLSRNNQSRTGPNPTERMKFQAIVLFDDSTNDSGVSGSSSPSEESANHSNSDHTASMDESAQNTALPLAERLRAISRGTRIHVQPNTGRQFLAVNADLPLTTGRTAQRLPTRFLTTPRGIRVHPHYSTSRRPVPMDSDSEENLEAVRTARRRRM